MKHKVLLFSLAVSGLATVLALWGIIQQPSANQVINSLEHGSEIGHSFVSSFKLFQASGCLGLLGISSFFVGLVFPKE